MVQAGMSPFEVLVTGTRNVGEYFANEDDFGTVAVGQRADLVLLAADPLQDIGNVDSIEGVMVAGRWLPRAEIDRRLQEIAAGYAGQPLE
jgi:imidazolonepropionase-like amidohydrolase